MKKILKIADGIFLSVPLTVILILALCVICLVVVFASYQEIFQSKWFLLYLSFIVFMMLYCSARRLPGIFRFYFSSQRHSQIFNNYFFASSQKNSSPKKEILSLSLASDAYAQAKSLLEKVFRVRGYTEISSKQKKGEEYFLFEKGKISIFGSHFIHLAIAILLVAGIITVWGGHFYDLDIKEGQRVRLEGTDIDVTLEKFSLIPSQIENFSDKYASRLRINRPDASVQWETLEVNSPVRIDGYRLYQNRFSYDIEEIDIEIYSGDTDKFLSVVNANMKARVILSKLDIGLEIKDFVPDFAIDPKGKVFSRSHFLGTQLVIFLFILLRIRKRSFTRAGHFEGLSITIKQNGLS